jgi:hypothetical protein
VTSESSLAAVLIISRNNATAEDLRAYFEGRGVRSAVSDRLDAADCAPNARAVVLFPDEFPEHAVAEGVRELARRFAGSRAVIVTRDTARFEDLVSEVGALPPGRLFVLPRPVWGWALLDRVFQPLPSPDEQEARTTERTTK